MRKLSIALALVAAVLASSGPVEARTLTKRDVWFVAPVPLGPEAWGVSEACAPSASGHDGVTYDDRVVRAPRGADLLVVRLFPTEDWDLYLCRRGKVLRYSARGLGDAETVVVSVRPGRSYRIRALNWAGQPQVEGSYAFYNL